MIFQKLELHIAQVDRIISKLRPQFDDTKKQEIYDNLINLFNAIKKSNYKRFAPDVLNITKHGLDIIFYGVQHLHYKEEKNIPKKLINCLNYVLNDWIVDGTKNYYILISHNNDVANYSLRAYDQGDIKILDRAFKSFFNINYTQSLIQISKPKTLFNDYISSTPVYHELGHFIDKNYQITKSLFRDSTFLASNPNENIMHYQEYFADIFASQYIGRSAIEPLNYIAFDSLNVDQASHPSNKKRINVLETFLQGSGAQMEMDIINNLKAITLARCGHELKIRNIKLDVDPFDTLKPVLIKEPEKIHSLFSEGWVNWLDENSKIRQLYPDPFECHKQINFLIMNSIV